MSLVRSAVCLGLSLLWLISCRGEPTPAADVIAQIEGDEVRHAELDRYLEDNALGGESALGSEVMSSLLDQLIEEKLLGRLAKDEGLEIEGRDPRAILEMLIVEMEPAAPTPREIEAYYLEHLEEFRLEERVRLRQLLLTDESLAERIRAEWVSGVPFDALVGRYSEAIAAYQNDGESLSREDLPTVLAETIFGLEPGDVSQVVTADYGYHLFQVTRRLSPEVLPLDVAGPEIRNRLSRRSHDEGVDVLLRTAGERYNVRVFRRNIPFNYNGDY